MSKSKTGWWNPEPFSNKRKHTFHYVADNGITLCKKWGYLGTGDLEEGNDEHSENCKTCSKKKMKLNKDVKKE